MSNKSTIKCPKCNHEFEASDAFRDEVQKELNLKARDWQAKREEEFRKREEGFQQQLNEQLTKQKQSIEETLRKSISTDFENKIKILSDTNAGIEEKLKTAREKELQFLKKEQALKDKEAEMEIAMQKKLIEERGVISEVIKKQEQERTAMAFREYEKKLDDQKKLIEEMQRKAEQGSMQLQGEVQELALEELLRSAYPFDTIEEVAKGTRGADCMQHVKNNLGQACGKIIYESKRTKAFTNEWIEKLKMDMRSQQADI
ncbi:MAG: DUF2130 domain-containing protein, partial [Bacteroidia bacterium]|nr:DUF2130 domain-containing protein [Bacteroidia bacterium]